MAIDVSATFADRRIVVERGGESGVNPFDYMTELERHAEELSAQHKETHENNYIFLGKSRHVHKNTAK